MVSAVRRMEVDGQTYDIVYVANDAPRHAVPAGDDLTSHRLEKNAVCPCGITAHSSGLLLHRSTRV